MNLTFSEFQKQQIHKNTLSKWLVLFKI